MQQEGKGIFRISESNTFSENKSITPWLQCSEGEDDMTDVDTKPMSGNKCINGHFNSEDKVE